MSSLQHRHRTSDSPSSIFPLFRRLKTLSQSKQNVSSRNNTGDSSTPRPTNKPSLSARLVNVFLRTWDLGFTAFGGPAVHFQIFHRRFIEGQNPAKEKWADEQTFQELFAICQALPGPGSTKMLFCLTLLHAGVVPALFVFFLWSLPGAIGMYALSLGISRIDTVLPAPVYALLSGLNSATVAIIALAAVQLASKAIVDKFTRILVIGGAVMGLCYNALWYFPVLMVGGGCAAVAWYLYGVRAVGVYRRWRKRQAPSDQGESGSMGGVIELREAAVLASGNVVQGPSDGEAVLRKTGATASSLPNEEEANSSSSRVQVVEESISTTLQQGKSDETHAHIISIRTGIFFTVLFFATFIATLVTRSSLSRPPLALSLFANMYLAGTVIFGGGPVVIPLLRSYTVDPGWVSGRDFLLGLALIQAFPGPNFNFAVYLGALSLQNKDLGYHSFLGAVLGFLGIFVPGLTLAVTVQGFWRAMRKHRWVVLLLQGINAAAVGLVFTAVYRLWEIGYLTAGEPGTIQDGKSLGLEAWWVVVASVTYSMTAWFGVPPAAAILTGGVLGLLWYAAVWRA